MRMGGVGRSMRRALRRTHVPFPAFRIIAETGTETEAVAVALAVTVIERERDKR